MFFLFGSGLCLFGTLISQVYLRLDLRPRSASGVVQRTGLDSEPNSLCVAAQRNIGLCSAAISGT